MPIIPARKSRNAAVSAEYLEQRRLLSVAVAAPEFDLDLFAYTEAHARWSESPVIESTPIKFSLQGAPQGMTIDPKSGAMNWAATEAQIGYYQFIVVGSNSAGSLDRKVNLQVGQDLPELGYAVNSFYGSKTFTYAVAGMPVSIQISNNAPTPGQLSIVSGPTGLVLNPSTGVIDWTPGASDVGNARIVVRSKNPYGQTDLVVNLPVFATPPVSNIAVKTDGLNAPTMSWTLPAPSGSQKITGYNIVLTAVGPKGTATYSFDRSSAATSFQLHGLTKGFYYFIPTVTPLDSTGQKGAPADGLPFAYAPTVSVLNFPSASTSIVAGQRLFFYLTQSDVFLPSTYAVVSGPKGLTVDAYGGVAWTPDLSQTGNYSVEFSATNSLGTITGSMEIAVTLPLPGAPASAWITNPSSTGFTIWWTPPSVNADIVAGYHIYIDYGPGGDSNSTDLQVSYTVPATANNFHFTAPVLGPFAARIVAFNSADVEGASTLWADVDNPISNPVG